MKKPKPAAKQPPTPTAKQAAGTPPLRLEWVAAGTLKENPANWRRHPEGQMRALKDLIEDPEVGWAGVLLFNEQTGQLIDGHARRASVAPDTLVPVIVGSWSPTAEAKILATLDPVAALAQADLAAYENLVAGVDEGSLWIRDLIDQVLIEARTDAANEDESSEDDDRPEVAGMSLQPFEKYDYVMLLFRNDQDFSQCCERLGIERVSVKYPGGKVKIGVGRVVDGTQALRKLCGS